ncbi:hypothetical protein ACFCYN_23935 [Gottfriedia sp. NPDC056225]|uniref:hypothetical protein n=1 Tax=Gottfriedia sp. NPDC056225 TaxID=3345751 RepID=UPI0035E2551E
MGYLRAYLFIHYFSSEQIHDLTGLNSNLIWNILLGVALIFLIASFNIIPLLTKKWLESRLSSLISSVIWLPYFVLFNILTGFLFPNNDLNNDIFGAGLILLFFLIFYPVSIFITTFIGTRLKKST